MVDQSEADVLRRELSNTRRVMANKIEIIEWFERHLGLEPPEDPKVLAVIRRGLVEELNLSLSREKAPDISAPLISAERMRRYHDAMELIESLRRARLANPPKP